MSHLIVSLEGQVYYSGKYPYTHVMFDPHSLAFVFLTIFCSMIWHFSSSCILLCSELMTFKMKKLYMSFPFLFQCKPTNINFMFAFRLVLIDISDFQYTFEIVME